MKAIEIEYPEAWTVVSGASAEVLIPETVQREIEPGGVYETGKGRGFDTPQDFSVESAHGNERPGG